MVSVHALLTKRDVASAVGWIGLAWFSPVLGGFLYFVLGINRVARRARRLRPGRGSAQGGGVRPHRSRRDRLRQLERGVGRLTHRTAEPGNALEIFQDGDEAYPPMLAAIAAARPASACPPTSCGPTRRETASSRRWPTRSGAAWRCGCWLTAWAAAGCSPPPTAGCAGRRAGRAVHALAAAVAHAVPEPAHAQEDPGGRRAGRLHRRHEHRPRERHGAEAAARRCRTRISACAARSSAARRRLRAGLGLRDARGTGGRFPGSRRWSRPAGPRRASSPRGRTRTSRRSSSSC